MTRWKHHALLTAIVLTVALPFLPLLLWSFSKSWFYPNVLPNIWGLRAWGYVFGTAGPQISYNFV